MPSIMLAQKPAATLAKPQNTPSSGCRPMLRKITPATGGRTTKAASPATLPLMPIKMMTAVTRAGDADFNIFCIKAARKPLFSATPAPITHTSTMPKGAKLEKLVTALLHICRKPSTESRFTTLMTLPVPGCTAETPILPKRAEQATTIRASRINRLAGSGSLLPATSTMFRKRSIRLFFWVVGFSVVIAITPFCQRFPINTTFSAP